MTDVTEERPGLDELLELYGSVAWNLYTSRPEVLERGVANSDFVVTARDDGKLVGLARAISDDATIAYLQDVLVHQGHHRRGIGRALVQRFLDRYQHVRQRVLLTDDTALNHDFYRACGLVRADHATPIPLRTYMAP